MTQETADIETSSEGYAARFAGPAGRWFLKVQEDIVLSLLKDPPPRTILDVGGGHGQLAGPLCAAGFDVTVLGSSESCAARLDGLIREKECRFAVGNVVELPFEPASFDAVVCFRLLPHCGQWRKLISELCRTARRAVVADYPTTRSLNRFSGRFFKAKRKLEGNTREWATFSPRAIREQFEACGFSLAAARPQFFLPMALHRMLGAPALSAAMEGVCRGLGLTRLFGSPVIVKAARAAGR